MNAPLVVDGCAGPGGMDLGARAVGYDPVGFEWDADACATRAAAGLRTVRADVTQVATKPLAGRLDGLIFSPPCQSFSSAGKVGGKRDLPLIYRLIADLACGVDSRAELATLARDSARRKEAWEAAWRADADTRGWWEVRSLRAEDAWMLGAADDPDGPRQDVTVLSGAGRRERDRLHGHEPEVVDLRSLVVVEPLRFALDCRPRWTVWEQVPPVLEIWEACALHLRKAGYSVWTGVLNAANYGVPQTRVRAFLLARLDGPVAPPPPTHGQHAGGQVDLFGPGLKPWVSMAEALGLGRVDRPARTVAGNRAPRWAYGPGATSYGTGWTLHTNRGQRPDGSRQTAVADRPAPALTGKSGGQWELVVGNQANAAVRADHEPAPTVLFGNAWGSVEWRLRNNTQENSATRGLDEPAGTLFFGGRLNDVSWVRDRPSTTVQGGPHIGRPGHRDRAGGESQFDRESVRITVEQAAVLQSFPADYPFRGNKTARFRQVGDSVPVLLAAHCVAAASGRPLDFGVEQ